MPNHPKQSVADALKALLGHTSRPEDFSFLYLINKLAPNPYMTINNSFATFTQYKSAPCTVVGIAMPAFHPVSTSSPEVALECDQSGWLLSGDKPIIHISTFPDDYKALQDVFMAQFTIANAVYESVCAYFKAENVMNGVCDVVPSSDLKFMRMICPEINNFHNLKDYENNTIFPGYIYEHTKPGTILLLTGSFVGHELDKKKILFFDISALRVISPPNVAEYPPIPYDLSPTFRQLRDFIQPFGRRVRTLNIEVHASIV